MAEGATRKDREVKNVRKLAEVMGGLEWVDILEEKKILKMDVRYIGTDYNADIDIYEECSTGKLLGKIN